MSAVQGLLRADLRDFAGYRSARSEAVDGEVWLNANESARASAIDAGGKLRRYPQPQPTALRTSLAQLYGCDPAQLLIGRGSDEAIDLLVRAICRPGQDAVLVTPPVFGMYAVCARLHGARVLEVPLLDDGADFRIDAASVAAIARSSKAKIVFLCSPGNPAGGVLPAAEAIRLATELEGIALVVVDEAYIEFATAPSLVPLVSSRPNLAVLRTLSKAHALAGIRLGCLIAHPDIIAALRRCQAPYPIAQPSAEAALRALSPQALALTAQAVDATCVERGALRNALARLTHVSRVYPSQANFLLVRFDDAAAAMQRLLDAGIVVRDMRHLPQLGDALRISIGTTEQNARVIASLQASVPA